MSGLSVFIPEVFILFPDTSIFIPAVLILFSDTSIFIPAVLLFLSGVFILIPRMFIFIADTPILISDHIISKSEEQKTIGDRCSRDFHPIHRVFGEADLAASFMARLDDNYTAKGVLTSLEKGLNHCRSVCESS